MCNLFKLYSNHCVFFPLNLKESALEIMILQCMVPSCITCKLYVITSKSPHTRCKWQTQQAWWQRVFIKINRRVNLLRGSTSTAVFLQLMWLNYFLNNLKIHSDYVTLFLCCLFEYKVDSALKSDFRRFWWNSERFQIQWHLLSAVHFWSI